MDTLFEKVILPQHPGTIIIVYHGSNSAYYNPDLKIVCDHLAFEGAPCAIPDRRCHSQDILSLKDSVSKFYAEQPEAKIRLEMLSRSWNPSTRKVAFNIKATSLASDLNGLYRIHVVLVEHNLIGFQWFVVPECGTKTEDTLYVHNAVARQMLYPWYGIV